MTMQLFITYESTTLDFQADGYVLLDGFYPESPDDDMESISEQFRVMITGSSSTDLKSKITAIRLAFEHARRHKNDAKAAYINFDVVDTGDAWRSKILNGLIMFDAQLDHYWRSSKAIVTVIVEHLPYWDAENEVQVPLTNGNGTDNITGLTVYNHDDSGVSPAHDNWVDIDAADVAGDMQGPTRLEITNSYATSRLYTLWMGQNWTDPDNFSHIMEGESSTTGTQQSDAGCSGGYYMQAALASGTEYTMFTWSLTDAFLDACRGGHFKMLARFYGSAPTSVRFRLRLQYAATTVWQSGQISLDANRALIIRDLFTLRLPPWLVEHTDLSSLTMILTGQQSTGASINVNLDFLQITPLDGWRMLECAGYGVVQNNRMVDDGFNQAAYVDNGSGDNKAGILVSYGNPIGLYPGKKQRIYFLMHSSTYNTAEIARTVSVKLFYRPRRKSL